MKKTYLIFGFILVLLLGFVLCSAVDLLAQPADEEEEEEIMARPNPMEHTTKGGSKVMLKEMPFRGAADPGANEVGVPATQLTGETQGKVNTEQQGQVKSTGQASVEGVAGESPVTSSAASAFGWDSGTKGPVGGDPVNPAADVSWDPTDINADVSSFGNTANQAGYVGEGF